ncbi:MAG: hypothetical protein ACRD16_15390 [Thermoanaerobaculia bacterium]
MTDAVQAERVRAFLRAGMVGCGSLLLVFLVMATLIGSFVSRHPDRYRSLLATVFDSLEDELAKSFAPDVTAADRAAFASARERFRLAWAAGRLPATAADRLRRRLLSAARKGRLAASDVRSLTTFLNGLASGGPRASALSLPAARAA